MNPEGGSQVIGRWFWLIAICGFLGAVAGYFVFPTGLTSPPAYETTITLGVSHFVSVNGTAPIEGTIDEDESPLSKYTSRVGVLARTSQFLSELKSRVADQGLFLFQADLPKRVTVTPDTGLFRITIRATGDLQQDSETLANATASLLIEETAAEERRIRESVTNANAERISQLLKQLDEVYDKRITRIRTIDPTIINVTPSSLVYEGTRAFGDIANNIARVTGDPELAYLNSEAEAIERELDNFAAVQQSFNSRFAAEQPLFVINPAETVAREPAARLDRPETVLGGAALGLVFGWLIANALERLRSRRQRLKTITEDEPEQGLEAIAERASPPQSVNAQVAALSHDPGVQSVESPQAREANHVDATTPARELDAGARFVKKTFRFSPASSSDFKTVTKLERWVESIPGVTKPELSGSSIRLNNAVELTAYCLNGDALSERLAKAAHSPYRIVEIGPERIDISLEVEDSHV